MNVGGGKESFARGLALSTAEGRPIILAAGGISRMRREHLPLILSDHGA